MSKVLGSFLLLLSINLHINLFSANLSPNYQDEPNGFRGSSKSVRFAERLESSGSEEEVNSRAKALNFLRSIELGSENSIEQKELNEIIFRISYNDPRQIYLAAKRHIDRLPQHLNHTYKQSDISYLKNLKRRFKLAEEEKNFEEMLIILNEVNLLNTHQLEKKIISELDKRDKKNFRKNIVLNVAGLICTIITVVIANKLIS